MSIPLEIIAAEATKAAKAASPEGITFPAIIDSTMRADFVSCPRKFYIAHMRGLRGVDSNVHLHFGGAFARGLECTRKAFWSPVSPCFRDVHRSMAEGVKGLLIAWGNFRLPSNVGGQAKNKTLEGCLDAFLSFFEKYPLESDPIVPLMVGDKPAVEFSFAIPIPYVHHPETGGPILYAGRFDMLARYGSNSIFVDDEKTTTALGASWLARWKLAAQFTGYVWASNEYGYPAAGALVRGLSILQKDIGHAFVIEQRHGFQVDRFKRQLASDIDRMIQCWNKDYWDYAFDKACSEFGGCPYQPPCLAPNEEDWLKNYGYAPWDPLGRSIN